MRINVVWPVLLKYFYLANIVIIIYKVKNNSVTIVNIIIKRAGTMKIKSKVNYLALAVSMLLLPVANANAGAIVSLVTADSTSKAAGFHPSDEVVLSANGRFVLFSNDGTAIVPNDTNNNTDIYMRDLVAKKTTLVSSNSSGISGDTGSTTHQSLLTPDGRYVVFLSEASNLVANDTNGAADIFRRDLKTGITTLISVSSTGKISHPSQNISSYDISPDGRFVAFSSDASDLVLNDTNGTRDVFIRDVKAKTTTLVSINAAKTDSGNSASGSGNSASSGTVKLSTNGRFIRFSSVADDLVANDNNHDTNCFVRDLKTKKTQLLESCDPSSADGRYFAFNRGQSFSHIDFNKPVSDVYMRDFATNKIKLVSKIVSGNANYIGSTLSAMSPNGRYVMFYSTLVDSNGKHDNVYVRDLVTNKTKLVSINKTGQAVEGNGYQLSDNGKTVLFTSPIDIFGHKALFIRDLESNKTTLLSKDMLGNPKHYDSIQAVSLSADGKFVVFSSWDNDLVAHDNSNSLWTSDVFIRDVKKGLTKLISMNRTGSNSGNGASDTPLLSADGKVVVFRSSATNLVSNGDNNSNSDLFAYKVR